MSENYFGREQSQAKHEILKRYLVPFANKILRTYPSLDFIDAFSGPWENKDHVELSDTSIGISIKTLHEIAEQLDHKKTDKRIRCIFNEADDAAFNNLSQFAERAKRQFPLIKIETFHGKFADNAAAIKATANHQFRLVFVDPTGFVGMPPQVLGVFGGRNSEIIVNFMRSFLVRFVSGDHKHKQRWLSELVGEKRASYLLDTGLTIQTLESEYLSMIRGTLGYKYAAMSPIHHPERDEIHFNLAYGTNHFEGMEVLRSAEYTALSDHDKTRFEKTQDPLQQSLFSDDALEVKGPYTTTREHHSDCAEDRIVELLKQNPSGLSFGDMSATIQQLLYLKRSELGVAVVNLAEAGLIEASWKARKATARKPHAKDLIKLLQ